MNTDYTLRNDGDDLEKYGCEHFNLDRQLNKYEEFWGNYVVPATNRPGNISMRTGIDKDYEKMLIISHGIFRDLLFANIFLKEIDQSNYGIAYLNSHSMILYTGNALQKTNDLINRHYL